MYISILHYKKFHFSAIPVKQTQFRSSGYTVKKIKHFGADYFTSEDIDTICVKKCRTICPELSKFGRDYELVLIRRTNDLSLITNHKCARLVTYLKEI